MPFNQSDIPYLLNALTAPQHVAMRPKSPVPEGLTAEIDKAAGTGALARGGSRPLTEAELYRGQPTPSKVFPGTPTQAQLFPNTPTEKQAFPNSPLASQVFPASPVSPTMPPPVPGPVAQGGVRGPAGPGPSPNKGRYFGWSNRHVPATPAKTYSPKQWSDWEDNPNAVHPREYWGNRGTGLPSLDDY